jgi:hypothetical protein
MSKLAGWSGKVRRPVGETDWAQAPTFKTHLEMNRQTQTIDTLSDHDGICLVSDALVWRTVPIMRDPSPN